MTDETKQSYNAVIAKSLERALNPVSVTTLLLIVSVFGLSWLFAGFSIAIPTTILFAGLAGCLDVLRRQAHLKLDERSKPIKKIGLTLETMARGGVLIELLDRTQEKEYGGFYFRLFRTKQLPVPVGVSDPLCPICKNELLESTRILFPARVRIEFSCPCGFKKQSKFTSPELTQQVIKLTGMI